MINKTTLLKMDEAVFLERYIEEKIEKKISNLITNNTVRKEQDVYEDIYCLGENLKCGLPYVSNILTSNQKFNTRPDYWPTWACTITNFSDSVEELETKKIFEAELNKILRNIRRYIIEDLKKISFIGNNLNFFFPNNLTTLFGFEKLFCFFEIFGSFIFNKGEFFNAEPEAGSFATKYIIAHTEKKKSTRLQQMKKIEEILKKYNIRRVKSGKLTFWNLPIIKFIDIFMYESLFKYKIRLQDSLNFFNTYIIRSNRSDITTKTEIVIITTENPLAAYLLDINLLERKAITDFPPNGRFSVTKELLDANKNNHSFFLLNKETVDFNVRNTMFMLSRRCHE